MKNKEGVFFRGSVTQEYEENRPTLTDSEILNSLDHTLPYDSKWAVALIRHAEKGGTIESFCPKTGISPSQLEKWKEIPQFNEAFRMAQASEIAYWENRLLRAIGSNKDEADGELIKVCRFKLESLGYGNKTYEANKMVFKESNSKKDKKVEISLAAKKDLAEISAEEVEELAAMYLVKYEE